MQVAAWDDYLPFETTALSLYDGKIFGLPISEKNSPMTIM
jgi:hypothetical protein